MKYLAVVTILLAMAGAAGAAGAKCVATTDVPEFKERIHEACDYPEADKYIKGFNVTGNHDVLRVTMTMVESRTGQPIAGTTESHWLLKEARGVWKLLYRFYPMARFEYVVRDGNDTPFCGFAWVKDPANEKELPVSAQCLSVVGPPEGDVTWWQK